MAAASSSSGLANSESQVPEVNATLVEAVNTARMFPKNGPDPTATTWGHDAGGKTFSAQEKLPKLPLPPLKSSCQRYLQSLKPLQSKEEHEASCAAVQRFLHGEGPILQAQLQAYDHLVVNWFEDYCYQAFLGDNSPVVYNSNAFASWPPDPDPTRNDQVTRAAALVYSTLQFSRAIREDRFPLEVFRGAPQCMYQYWWLFGVVRVPRDDGGRLRMDTEATHIIVMCRGQMYRLHVLDEDTGEIMDQDDLAENFKSILRDAQTLSHEDAASTSVGVLTTADQDFWARCRTSLAHGSVRNSRNFAAIDSSLFALCLDDSSPENSGEICRNMICGTDSSSCGGIQVGTCLNRWYDKLAVIVCRNGAAGMNFEHTCTDGSVDIRMACDIYEGSISPLEYHLRSYKTLQNGRAEYRKIEGRLKKLEWDIPQGIHEALSITQKHLSGRLQQHQITTLKFQNFGKAFITASGFSPDAFFQMAIHAAYYRISGDVGNGFEPILTRHFLHGRTDVARTLTAECAAFARTFNDEKASAAQKLEAFRTATSAHTENLKHCAKGFSHHRHLAVLNQLWKRKQAFLQANSLKDTLASMEPTIFSDPGWSRLGTTNVMGSNVDNPSIEFAGFGAPSPQGHTVCYYIRKDHVAMSINSRNGKHEEYADSIERTLRELQKLIEEVTIAE